MKELIGKKVQVLDGIDSPTGVIGELVHETNLQFCILLDEKYFSYHKAHFSYQEYKSPEDIRNEKLLEIVMDYYHDNIYTDDMLGQINRLFKEV